MYQLREKYCVAFSLTSIPSRNWIENSMERILKTVGVGVATGY
jgi:hypothetical protein